MNGQSNSNKSGKRTSQPKWRHRRADKWIVTYRRISTDYQHADAQEHALRELVAAETASVMEIEEVVSGRKMKGEKLAMLTEMVANDEVSKIIVYHFDRLGRNVLEGCRFIELCIAHNVEVVSKCQPFDVRTPEGKFMFHQLMVMAEYFLGNLSRGTSAGLKRAKERGTFVGGTKGSWIRQDTAAKLDDVLRYADKGLSYREIGHLVGMDERTVSRLINTRDNPPKVRERVWDR